MNIIKQISQIYQDNFGQSLERINELPQSGSYRQYYRILNNDGSTLIAAFNSDKKENRAFVHFSEHFYKLGLKVPEILCFLPEKGIYFLEDLGNTSFYSYLEDLKAKNQLENSKSVYQQILSDLADFQIKGGVGLDYGLCYPRAVFDRQSILWDLNYFKYHFLKIARIPFDEQLLENDFETFADYLLQAGCGYFLFRDFQSRNIMLKNEKTPYYIDYQGGRKGALQYDVASLLNESKINLPFEMREELLEYYIRQLSEKHSINTAGFKQFYYPYVLVRLMQAMGAYGFRGLIENKPLFVKSIPFALKSLEWILKHINLEVKIPEIIRTFQLLIESKYLETLMETKNKLTISIRSFSFKKGIPVDGSGHGGGFVFDCRGIKNPGKIDAYKKLTGKDEEVRNYLIKESEIMYFMESVFRLVNFTVKEYLLKDFEHLQVAFGCTGGQHRSVFASEEMKKYLVSKYGNQLAIDFEHLEI